MKEFTVELPEPVEYPSGEKEWSFAGNASDGWVNRDENGIVTFDLAEDNGSMDGLPTVAEGRVPAELVRQFAEALLAALASDAREG